METKTPYFYGAAIRELREGPEGHTIVRLWLGSPEPHALAALAAALDEDVERTYGPTACAAVHRPHPEALTAALDVVLPLMGEEAGCAAAERVLLVLRACNAHVLRFEQALNAAKQVPLEIRQPM
jgi:hypothetical protein